MIPAEKIIIALDTCDKQEFIHLLDSLAPYPVWVKVGMELFYSLGTEAVMMAHDKGFKIFLDLKLHDIPNTVAAGIKALSKLPIGMINIHAAGGAEMMRQAALSLKDSPNSPLLIAVTQLTSTTQEQMNQEQRISGDVLESVVHYAKLAQTSGCDGVVSSPLEVAAIKLTCGSRFLTVTPGIRPADNAHQDQKRVTTPAEALKAGTDFMVIGRPITQHQNPTEALRQILQGHPS